MTTNSIDDGLLRCPHCHSDIERQDHKYICKSCNRTYGTVGDKYDFRLSDIKETEVKFTVGETPQPNESIFRHPIDKKMIHNTTPNQLQDCIPSASSEYGNYALDLGCGGGRHRDSIENNGWEWIGVDVEPSSGASILGDAHSLPFQSNTFGLVYSIAAFEHLQNPLVAIKEINRVLEPGGQLIGSVAFSEGYHSRSHFHPTHHGVYELLRSSCFDIENIYPYNISKERWWGWIMTGLNWEPPVTYARDHFRPLPMWIRVLITLPLAWFQHLYYRYGSTFAAHVGISSNPPDDVLRTKLLRIAGQYCFIATKRK